MVPAAFERAEQWGVTPNVVVVNSCGESGRPRISSQQQIKGKMTNTQLYESCTAIKTTLKYF